MATAQEIINALAVQASQNVGNPLYQLDPRLPTAFGLPLGIDTVGQTLQQAGFGGLNAQNLNTSFSGDDLFNVMAAVQARAAGQDPTKVGFMSGGALLPGSQFLPSGLLGGGAPPATPTTSGLGSRAPIGGGPTSPTLGAMGSVPVTGTGSPQPGGTFSGPTFQPKTTPTTGMAPVPFPGPGGGPVSFQPGGATAFPPPGAPPSSAPPFSTTPIDPNSNLRGQQINPTFGASTSTAGLLGSLAPRLASQQIGPFGALAPTDLTQSRDLVNQAVGQVGNLGDFEASPESLAARQASLGALQNLQGPDRLQLASDAFGIFRDQREPRFQQDLRRVGQSAAKFGRLGAGMTTNELTDISSQRERDLDLLQRQLTNDALGQTLADRLGVLGGTLAAGGQFGQEDLSRAGFNQSQALNRAGLLGGAANQLAGFGQIARGDAEADRAFDFNSQLANAGLLSGAFGQLMGLNQQQFGQQQTLENALRGERDRMDFLGQQGIQNRVQQALLEDQLSTNDLNRQLSIESLFGNIGGLGTGTNSLINALLTAGLG